MQRASIDRPAAQFDAAGLVERVNSLAGRVRKAAGRVIRHHNAIGSTAGALAGPVTVRKCSEILA